VVVLASGSEVELALKAADKVAGKSVKVVSVVSLEAFCSQPKAIRDTIAPREARIVACEAGRSMGWDGLADAFLGVETFGESGPGSEVAVHLGLTVDALVSLINA
jgi:transketolase